MPPEPAAKRVVSFFDGQNLFWHAKAAFGHQHPNYDPNALSEAVCRANVTSRPIRYRTREVRLPDGTRHTIDAKQEKGIDLRLGLDVVRLARQGQFDVAVIFSQDQDLAEVATEIRDISRAENRWLKVVSAFPASPAASAAKGIDKTDWFRMNQAFYDACLDPRDYRH